MTTSKILIKSIGNSLRLFQVCFEFTSCMKRVDWIIDRGEITELAIHTGNPSCPFKYVFSILTSLDGHVLPGITKNESKKTPSSIKYTPRDCEFFITNSPPL